MSLSAPARALLAESRVAHLATADQYARPHVVPIVFVYEEPFLFTPIDRKPKSVADWRELRRVRNIDTNGRVSIAVDRYDEEWSRLAWVRLEGTADVLTSGPDRERALALLERKYEQYRELGLADAPVIRVRVERATEWRAS